MAFRNIVIENPAKISVKNDQLIVTTQATHHVPLEDISALSGGQRHSVAYAMERLVQSFGKDLRDPKQALMLPELIVGELL